LGLVLLTGSTGFLGAHIAARLIKETDHDIATLVRAENKEAAIRRLSREWWDWPELIKALDNRVKVFTGNVSEIQLGVDDTDYEFWYTTSRI